MKDRVDVKLNRRERAFIALYHFIERLDGEQGGVVALPYQYAEKLKLSCLRQIEEGRQ